MKYLEHKTGGATNDKIFLRWYPSATDVACRWKIHQLQRF
jgi:hypothetical protein